MRHKLFVILTILFLPTAIYAFDWPVSEPLVISTFGSDKWETFGNGIEIFGGGIDVRSSGSGELIYYEEAGKGCLPSGLGSFAVIEHERKLRTLYSRIELSEDIAEIKTVTKSDIVGTTRRSEQSLKPHLYFSAIDSEFEQYVNPLLLLDSIVDNKPPVIGRLGIINDSGFSVIDKKTVVKAGRAEIAAEIFDPCMADDLSFPMSPFKIYLFHNGEEIFYVNFESLVLNSGEALIQSRTKLKYDEFYLGNGLVSLGKISLVPGESRFEVLVSDYSGNETGKTFQLTVTE